jgi:hypothetical protein
MNLVTLVFLLDARADCLFGGLDSLNLSRYIRNNTVNAWEYEKADIRQKLVSKHKERLGIIPTSTGHQNPQLSFVEIVAYCKASLPPNLGFFCRERDANVSNTDPYATDLVSDCVIGRQRDR